MMFDLSNLGLWRNPRNLKKSHTRNNNRAQRRSAGTPLGVRGIFEKLEDRVVLTHFRFGTIAWEVDAADPSGQTVQFNVEQAWRRSAFGNPNVGATVNIGGFNHGDGTSQTIPLTVTSVNTTEDWFVGTATLTHRYTTAGDRTAFFNICCRISTLQNNRDQVARTETIVNVGAGNSSPVSSLPPIVQVADNQIATFQIAAIDPDGDSLTYRLSTASEAGTSSFVQPPGFSVSPSGQVTWDVRDTVLNTSPGHLWSAQIMIEDGKGAKTPLDFILQIGQPAAQNNPPTISTDPTGPFNPVAGQTITFNVTAADSDGSITNLQALNAPSGMTLSPFSPGTTSTRQVTWTPTQQQSGQSFIVTFQATDDKGATAQTSVTISPAANLPPSANAGGPYVVGEGSSITLLGTGSDPEGTPVSFEWDLDYDGTPANFSVDALGATALFDAALLDGPSIRTVALRVTDGFGLRTIDTATIGVLNVTPHFDPGPDEILPASAAGVFSRSINFTDPGMLDVHTVIVDFGDGAGNQVSVLPLGDRSFNLNRTYATEGTFTVSVTVEDDDFDSLTDTFDITVELNSPPIANAGGPYTGTEGSSLQLDATGTTDNEEPNTALIYEWDFDYDGVTFDVDAAGIQPMVSFADDIALRTIAVRVTDNGGLTDIATTTLEVTNVAPVVGPITASLDPQQVNAAITATASFTDVGTLDTHTAVWDWGDGTPSAGVVTETNGSGTVSGEHTYTEAGVYTVTLTVTDDDGGSATETFQYVVVYDPSAGFVTGGGWIDSPAGAYADDPLLSGKANFGFNAKYKKGANKPDGQTEFQFKAGNLNFHSSSYEWLVVAGANAKFKGEGTINGQGNYGFMLTATDGQVSGGGGVDLFRIKIWDKANGDAVVYDNQPDEADDSIAGTALGGGQIVIHASPGGGKSAAAVASGDAGFSKLVPLDSAVLNGRVTKNLGNVDAVFGTFETGYVGLSPTLPFDGYVATDVSGLLMQSSLPAKAALARNAAVDALFNSLDDEPNTQSGGRSLRFAGLSDDLSSTLALGRGTLAAV